jgi:type IV secretion system protein VirB10
VTIPAGSKVLLSLKAAVDTKAAKPGDPVYLTSTFPVIVGDHVVIPAGMDVMGVIDSVVRPGRVKGRAAVTMHFTTLVLPNGTVVDIPGSVNAVPGAGGPTVKGNENTVQQAGGKGQDARNMQTATAAGVGVGGIAGLSSGMGTGIGYGAAAGGAAGLAYTLLTRGKDVVLEVGQPVEMALQRPLVLSEKDVYVPPAGTGPQFVPADNQPKPLPKPKPE